MEIIIRRRKKDLTKQEWQDIQQPLDYNTGWENAEFSKLYPNEKNPWKGTERDLKNKKFRIVRP